MDRQIVLYGQLGRETDLLNVGQFAMTGIGKLAEAVFGTDTIADGWTLIPTVPASLTVNLGAGQVYSRRQLEQSPVSSLQPDVRPIVKQGINLDATPITLVVPTTANFVVEVLIQAQYSDIDDGNAILPFYNPANFSQPFNGPGNNNQATSTRRRGIVSIQQKYGQPSAAGTQVTPTPDAGWSGLFVVTLSFGQTAITAGNIRSYFAAPVIPDKLQNIPAAIQRRKYNRARDTSPVANTVVLSLTPRLLEYVDGTEINFVPAFDNTTSDVTINVNGVGPSALRRRDGTVLAAGDLRGGIGTDVLYDGTFFRLKSAGFNEGVRTDSAGAPLVYVRSDGNDLNTGATNTAAGAFKTIGAAYTKITTVFGYGQPATIQIGVPGVYDPMPRGYRTAGDLTVVGDPNNPSGYIISGNAAGKPQVNAAGGAGVTTFSGITFQNAGGTAATTFAVGASAYVLFANCIFANLATGTNYHIAANDGAVILVGIGCKFSGNVAGLFLGNGGVIIVDSQQTITGNPAWSTAGVYAKSNGKVDFNASASFVGTATGPRYLAISGGIIDTNGAGANFIPGSTAGTVATNGQYI